MLETMSIESLRLIPAVIDTYRERSLLFDSRCGMSFDDFICKVARTCADLDVPEYPMDLVEYVYNSELERSMPHDHTMTIYGTNPETGEVVKEYECDFGSFRRMNIYIDRCINAGLKVEIRPKN